jgi:hypothetical protein
MKRTIVCGVLVSCIMARAAGAQDALKDSEDLRRAYCVGVLNVVIRDFQKMWAAAQAPRWRPPITIDRPGGPAYPSEPLPQAIQLFQDLRTHYQTVGVPRMNAPGPAAMAAAQRRGESDFAKVAPMERSCAVKCKPPPPSTKLFIPSCLRACRDSELEVRIGRCERGK